MRIPDPATRRFAPACLMAIAVLGMAATTAEAVEIYGIEGPSSFRPGLFLAHFDGKVWFAEARAGRCDWELIRTSQGILLRVSSSETDPFHRWYLSYNPRDDGKEVLVLTREPVEESYWSADKVTSANLDPFDRTIHAKGGRFAGWYLDADPARGDNADSRGPRTYAPVLKPRPEQTPRFYLFEIAP